MGGGYSPLSRRIDGKCQGISNVQCRPFDEDRMEEACGVFGIFAPGEDLFRLTGYALFALQHRGQESAGIALSDGKSIHLKKGVGLVSEVLPDLEAMKNVPSVAAVGHVRYSTSGGGRPENAQPLLIEYRHGSLAVVHNGNLINALDLRDNLEDQGSIFQTTTDSELIAHLIARYGYGDLEASLTSALPYLRGAYNFLFLNENSLVGVRDPHGIHPLSLGKWKGHYVLASETCAFDTIGAEMVRDIEPGEMVIIDQKGLTSRQFLPSGRRALCVFEYIYFARPDSNIHGKNVHLVRKELGRRLAREQPAAADLVTGVPDSSLSAASGYAEELGIPYELGLIKNKYIGRTFIQPSQAIRSVGVQLKLNPIYKVIEGKSVVVVDDSIVRGTTSQKLVNMFFKAGAREVHLRISSPPVIAPCFYGIDTPTYEELIGSYKQVEEIRRQVGATSLGYLGYDNMIESTGLLEGELCAACFSGHYPITNEGEQTYDTIKKF